MKSLDDLPEPLEWVLVCYEYPSYVNVPDATSSILSVSPAFYNAGQWYLASRFYSPMSFETLFADVGCTLIGWDNIPNIAVGGGDEI